MTAAAPDQTGRMAGFKPRGPRGTTQDARIVRTGEALHAALLTLLDGKAFEHITIREITAEARVSYATFFRHYPTKEALFDHIAADEIERLVALTMPVLDSADSRAAFTALCIYVDERRTLWTALLTGGAAAAMRDELLSQSRRVAADRAPTDGWLPVDLGVTCTVGLMVEVISWWLAQPDGSHPIAYVAMILDRLTTAATDGDFGGSRDQAAVIARG